MQVSNEAQRSFNNAELVIFDFDGVIVDSNTIKSNCFRELAAPFGPNALARLEAFFFLHPHATRFEAIDSILDDENVRHAVSSAELLRRFSNCSISRVAELSVAPALFTLREADSRDWALVSATEQGDMRDISKKLGISSYFQGGVFGSPKTKLEHIRHLCSAYSLVDEQIVLLGDRKSDMLVAAEVGISFIFVSEWSDSSERDLEALHNAPTVKSLAGLLEMT